MRRAAADAIKFTVDQTALKKKTPQQPALALAGPAGANSITKAAATAPDLTPTNSSKPGALPPAAAVGSKVAAFEAQMDREAQLAAMVCSLENKDACLMCGS